MSKIKLSEEQLRAIAELSPGSTVEEAQTALAPIGRVPLFHAYDVIRSLALDASNEVVRIELARYARVVADPDAAPLPLDSAAHQQACIKRDRLLTDADAAWARVQRFIDRASRLVREQRA